MKSVLEFFKSKWFIQLVGIIALCLLLWFFAPLIAVAGHVPFATEMSRLIAILVVVVVWALNNFRVQLQASRANSQLATDLTTNTDAADNQLEQEVDAELGTMGKRFEDAIQTLKKGSKNSYGKNYLYDLPWYIIIGPPGSGKTTALINSGLDFPLADQLGKGAVRGVGGTRNCDWWFTDQAVLLDTAGRYVTQDSHEAVDKAAWIGFLELLKKYRPRRPVNGVVITMGLSDLLKQSEEERSQHAQAIRRRIEELHHYFGIRFPIYMLFTKADLIAGFTDFFATLSKEERAQIWGVTFPGEEGDKSSDVLVKVGTDFDDLLTRLNEHLPRRLQEERDLQRRNLIFGFPQRMLLLKENLLQFLQECYGGNRYQSSPYLRGVYFSSGTQEGTPIDRLMGMLANTFKLDRVSTPLFSGQGKSFFITRLLKDVIFQEALLVGINPRLERLQSLMRNGLYATAAAMILAMSALWLTSYNKNNTVLAQLDTQIQQYNAEITKTPAWQTDFAGLLKYLNNLQSMVGVFPDDKPWLMRFGLYQGDKLRPVIDETYNELLQKQFLPRIKSQLEQRLQQSTGNPDMLYSLLEVYLMLGDSKRLQPELVKTWLALEWQKTYATDTDTQAQLMSHLNNLLTQPLEQQVLNERLIAATRQILNRIPVSQQIYMRIKNEALQDKSKDLKLLDALGNNADRVFAGKNGSLAQISVPYFFTYDGFYQYFLKQVKQQAEDSIAGSWVLGTTAKLESVDIDQLQAAIQASYFQDYINQWDALIANVKLRNIGSAQQATEILEFASSPDSPLKKLLETVNKETSLTKPPTADPVDKLQAAADKAVDTQVAKMMQAAKAGGLVAPAAPALGTVVEEHFLPITSLVRSANGGPVPLDRTMEALAQLYGYMIDLSGTSNVGGVAIEKAKQSGGGDPVAKMKAESAHLPEPLKSMTQQLASSNQSVILGSSKAQLNRLWQSEVLPLYKSAIRGRYPFARGSDHEVNLADFARLFGQGGVLDQFFNNNLRAFVDTSGSTWRMISQNNQSISISADALAQLQAANKIRQLYFAGGAVPVVKFSLKPITLDFNATSFWMDIEGQQVKYNHTDMTKDTTVQWPGVDGSHQVSFGFESKDGKKSSKQVEGQWAWFKLMQVAQVQKSDKEKYLLTFSIDNLIARYELSASSADDPFSAAAFANFHLPESL